MKEVDIDLEALKAEIALSSLKSSIILGGDSKTFNRDGVRECAYCVTVIIHIDSKHGGRIFKDIKIERDFGNITTPAARLMNEVYKVTEIAAQLVECVGERPFEIHLDISNDKKYKSNKIVKEACGYVFGMMGFEPMIKPDAWAASAVADRFAVKTANSNKAS